MTRGIRIGRILGIDIVLDASWFLMSILIAWTFANTFRDKLPSLGFGDRGYVAMGIVAALLFFASLLAHEMGHAIVALRKGIAVRSITLFFFGGVAQIRNEPKSPGDEFKIAIAGPIVSVILAAVFLGGAWLSGLSDLRSAAPPTFKGAQTSALTAVAGLVGMLNISLAVFNMAPGFPLDGGRVLRAAVWAATKDLVKATRVASTSGQVLAWLMIGFGVYAIIATEDLFLGIWLVLIGLFLYQAAASGYQQVLLRNSLRGLMVGDLMTREVISIPGNARLGSAVDEYFLTHRHTSFPVLGYGDAVEGIITLQHIRQVPRERWEETTVRQAMVAASEVITTHPREAVSQLLDRMRNNPIGRFLVVETDRLVGYITASDIARHFEIRASIEDVARAQV